MLREDAAGYVKGVKVLEEATKLVTDAVGFNVFIMETDGIFEYRDPQVFALFCFDAGSPSYTRRVWGQSDMVTENELAQKFINWFKFVEEKYNENS